MHPRPCYSQMKNPFQSCFPRFLFGAFLCAERIPEVYYLWKKRNSGILFCTSGWLDSHGTRHSDQLHWNWGRDGAAEAGRDGVLARLRARWKHGINLPQTLRVGFGEEHGRQIVAIQPNRDAVAGGFFRQTRDPQRDAAMETVVDEVSLPGLAVRHDGDAKVGGFGAGGALAALLGGKIDADAHGISPRAVRGA